MSTALYPGDGILVPPYGRLYLDLNDPLAAIGPVPMPALHATRGFTELTFDLGPGTSPLRPIATSLPSWSAQAVVIAPNEPTLLTNVYSFRPILLPKGFTQATVTQGTPVVIPRTVQHQTFAIRNDGRGALTVQQKVGSTNLGPAQVIPERAQVRVLLAAPGNAIEVAGAKTTAIDFVWAFNR
jgi:hypothetical protein